MRESLYGYSGRCVKESLAEQKLKMVKKAVFSTIMSYVSRYLLFKIGFSFCFILAEREINELIQHSKINEGNNKTSSNTVRNKVGDSE